MKTLFLACTLLFFCTAPCFAMDPATGKEKELFEAIEAANTEKVQELLTEGANFDDYFDYKNRYISPFDFAEEKGNPAIIKLLRAAKMSPEEKAFFKAVEEGNVAEVKRLIFTENIDPNIENEDQKRPLTIAVNKNKPEMIKTLLLLDADINHPINKQGQTVLNIAIAAQNIPMLQTLLDNAPTINIDQKNANGDTPLMQAISTGNLAIIKTILTEVPDPSIVNNHGKTAKDFAQALKNKGLQAQILKLLDSAQQQFTLFQEIQKKQIGYIPFLISTGISTKAISFVIRSIQRNPLMAAINTKNLELVKILVNAGAPVNQTLKLGFTPLLAAVGEGTPEIINYLLSKKANPNAKMEIFGGATPLFMVLEKPNLIDPLVKAGANINQTISLSIPGTPNNITPLMTASRQGFTETVQKLLRLGANPLLKNSENKTALDLAKEKKAEAYDKKSYEKIIQLLEEAIRTGGSLLSRLQSLTRKLQTLQKVLGKKA